MDVMLSIINFYADIGFTTITYPTYVLLLLHLLIQIIILYLLLNEIICLDDENFLGGMHFGGVTYLLALSLSICTRVTFQ